MKTAWEYRKIKLTASNHGTDEILHLNVAGEEGWEIVCTSVQMTSHTSNVPSRRRTRQSAEGHFRTRMRNQTR